MGEVLEILSSSSHAGAEQQPFHLRTSPIPLLPPSTAEQAEKWSREYWPTIYRKNNPFGPHPSIVARAADETFDGAAYFMGLARIAGEEVFKASIGLPVGAVVGDRSNPASPAVVVAAGDARWTASRGATKTGSGNVMGHAVMRAIGLIARKRRGLVEDEQHDTEVEPGAFADMPLTEIERVSYVRGSLPPGGYLCLDLEIYITHEPCIMCSMAILHSRFGKVVFGECMPHTGGLTAETVRANTQEMEDSKTGYGLFWRPELNWKLLAWQWVDDEPLPSGSVIMRGHA